ncbi:hypothetical protein, partial [Acinetobacter baumannii]|uniref:hypothetical protein n=1 Tax=Acinetobacter baumannii TaxID=470 RepID=UPI0014885E08
TTQEKLGASHINRSDLKSEESIYATPAGHPSGDLAQAIVKIQTAFTVPTAYTFDTQEATPVLVESAGYALTAITLSIV